MPLKRFFVLFLLTVGLGYSAGCTPFQVTSQYRFADAGVPKRGDPLYISVKSGTDFISDLSFSYGDSPWIPIENKKERAKMSRTPESGTAYTVRYVLRLPALTTDSLRFRVEAVSSDGARVEDIIVIREVVDSFKPKGRVTFNPFSL